MSQRHRRRRRNHRGVDRRRRGLSLVETLVVVAIAALLMAMVFMTFSKVRALIKSW